MRRDEWVQGFLVKTVTAEEGEDFLKNSEPDEDGTQQIWSNVWLKKKQDFLKGEGCHFLLLIWQEHEEKCMLFFSDTKKVRSLEFLDYLLPEFGLVRGDAGCALGRINTVILNLLISEQGAARVEDYVREKAKSYFWDCDWIDAETYADAHQKEIEETNSYQKRKIPWAFVKTTDIAAPGKQLLLKSLENESGLTVAVAQDVYIMIGCRGEVYDIKRGKFENTYQETQEGLDVFARMMEFIPELMILPGREYVSLEEYARLCYPRQETGVYAKKLERRTKVFPADGSQEYYLGRPGDYLVIRREDLTDIYIVQGDIFEETYELMPRHHCSD